MSAVPTPPEMFADTTRKRQAAGEYIDGIWYDGGWTEATITASVQPASGTDLERLPEGLRTTDIVTVFTSDALRVANETSGYKSDRVVFQGEEYEVIEVEQWTLPQLPHYKATAARVSRTGNPVESD